MIAAFHFLSSKEQSIVHSLADSHDLHGTILLGGGDHSGTSSETGQVPRRETRGVQALAFPGCRRWTVALTRE